MSKQTGFTLIEMVMVLLIASAVLSMFSFTQADESRSLSIIVQKTDQVVAVIRNARDLSSDYSEGNEGETFTARINESAGDDFIVSTSAMIFESGKYSSNGVRSVSCSTGGSCSESNGRYEVSIKHMSGDSTPMYLCVDKLTARIVRGEC